MTKNSINKFYVYTYLDPRKPGKYVYEEYSFDYEPFYIGKGQNKRSTDHINESKNIIKNNINKNNCHNISKIIKILEQNLKPIILKIEENLTENKAFDLELKLISIIGRSDLKIGPLVNKTNGGEGMSGYVYPEKRKETMSKLMSGENNPMYGKSGELSPNFGTFWTEERVELMSKKLSGSNNPMFNKTHSNDTRQKLSNSHKGLTKHKYKLINPEGEIFYANKGLTEFCDKYNLSQSKLSLVVNGKRKHHKGWKCEYL